ncbi:MAG: hypothetical protein C7B46_20600 [Sulfobacillus benefaciens]|uniref:Uncharacterized protein n=1 Tax=Sulfobacillus benefaciens TaxID=453960 RepID=A0A2T2WTC6_9FIRM|nr:MAG: hypothetical protein C7B46_20600 [Sulfobacillus benefaciens]
MKRAQWHILSVVFLGIVLAGCGVGSRTAAPSPQTSSVVSDSAHAQISSPQQDPVHITVQQGHGSLTVHVTTSRHVSSATAHQLQSDVQQLNQLLQQLQNP